MKYLKVVILFSFVFLTTNQAYSQSYGNRTKSHMGINPKSCKKKHKAMKRHGISGLTGSSAARSKSKKRNKPTKRRR